MPWNSKAVGSAPDQTATFPEERSLVRLLAVVVGVGVGVVGSRWLYICMFLWTLMSVDAGVEMIFDVWPRYCLWHILQVTR